VELPNFIASGAVERDNFLATDVLAAPLEISARRVDLRSKKGVKEK
jgi:hypothetical protein